MTKSSHYTGYEDLDAKLRELYQRQLELEAKSIRGKLNTEETTEYKDVLHRQDGFLYIGELRDSRQPMTVVDKQ